MRQGTATYLMDTCRSAQDEYEKLTRNFFPISDD